MCDFCIGQLYTIRWLLSDFLGVARKRDLWYFHVDLSDNAESDQALGLFLALKIKSSVHL